MAKRLHLRLRSLQQGQSKILFSASGTPMPVVATAEIAMCFSGLWISHFVKGVPNISHDLILGAHFLRQTSATIDYKSGVVTLADDLVTVPLQYYENQQ